MCSGNAETAAHIPVLFHAVLEGLRVRPGGTYIDLTVGGGGHAAGILARSSPRGRLLGLDRDLSAVQIAERRLASYAGRLVLVHSSYVALGEIAPTQHFVPADGVLLDLGLSTYQLRDPSRGFGFSVEGPLDMRFDPTTDAPTAADLVNELSPEDLGGLIRQYGEERQARRIARAIVAARPIESTRQLADIVRGAAQHGRDRVHPATRTFQALRIAVNGELDALSDVLPQAVEALAPGGRLVVISFHSLEDRIVKRFVRRESMDCICPPELPVCCCEHQATLRVITPRPVRPSSREVEANRRARSARLRIAERVSA